MQATPQTWPQIMTCLWVAPTWACSRTRTTKAWLNHWVDVHITQAGSAAVVSDVTPIIRIVDKATGEAHDLAGVMGVNGGMSSDDVRFGQNAFLPDGTYQITVLLGPADTAQFRDVVVTTSAMVSEPDMSHAMGAGDGMNTADEPATQP